MRILVVEDEKRLARTIGDLLEANNYIVDLCYDGESGLDLSLIHIYRQFLLSEQPAHLRPPGQEADLRRPAP